MMSKRPWLGEFCINKSLKVIDWLIWFIWLPISQTQIWVANRVKKTYNQRNTSNKQREGWIICNGSWGTSNQPTPGPADFLTPCLGKQFNSFPKSQLVDNGIWGRKGGVRTNRILWEWFSTGSEMPPLVVSCVWGSMLVVLVGTQMCHADVVGWEIKGFAESEKDCRLQGRRMKVTVKMSKAKMTQWQKMDQHRKYEQEDFWDGQILLEEEGLICDVRWQKWKWLGGTGCFGPGCCAGERVQDVRRNIK